MRHRAPTLWQRRPRLSYGLLVGIVLLFCIPVPISADFLDHYKEGVKAAEAGDWSAVRSQMTAAVAEQPQSNARLRKRLYFKRYIPHYFLGRARFELGDCKGALAAWKTSEEQGILQRFPEHSELAGFRKTCMEQAEALAAKVRQAEEALHRAQDSAGLLDGLPTPDMRSFWDQGSDSLALRAARAQALLDEARQALADRGDPANPEALKTAESLSQQAQSSFEKIRQSATDRLQEAESARDSLTESLEPLRRRAQRSLAAIAFLRPYPNALAGTVSQLNALLAASENLGPATTAADLERLQERLDDNLRRLNRQAQAPPKALMTAAEAFFSGRYEDVLTELDGVNLRSREAKAHGHLFLAAARFALYVSGGEQDSDLFAAARGDALASRAANAKRPPDPRAFSPRFIEFFLAQEESEEATEGESGVAP